MTMKGRKKELSNKKIARGDRSPDRQKRGKEFKWTKNKIIALSLIGAGVLATVIFAVIFVMLELGSIRPIKSTEEEARAVGECGGYEIRYEELRFLTLSARAELDEKYGEYENLSASDKELYNSELSELVKDNVKNNYVILSLCEKYGVDTDSKDVKKYVEEQINTLVKEELGGGKEEYKAFLAESGLSDSFLRLMYKVDYLEAKLLDKLVSDKSEIKYNDSNLPDFVTYALESRDYVKAIHAYYPKNSENHDPAKMKEDADAALAALLAESDAENRYSLMKSTIGKAPFVPGFSTTGSDYYMTYEQMDDRYEKAVFAISEYEVADKVIETGDGYYVIMRVPKVRDEISKRAYELVEQYQYSVLKQMEKAYRADLSFEGNEYFESLVLAEIE